MSMLNCYLAAEKETNNLPFTVCEVSTWFGLEVHMLRDREKGLIKKEAHRLYKLFGIGGDKTERGISWEDLKTLVSESNGGIYYIPKGADSFLRVQ